MPDGGAKYKSRGLNKIKHLRLLSARVASSLSLTVVSLCHWRSQASRGVVRQWEVGFANGAVLHRDRAVAGGLHEEDRMRAARRRHSRLHEELRRVPGVFSAD